MAVWARQLRVVSRDRHHHRAERAARKTRRLTLPVLAIGAAKGLGEGPANTMKLVADNVQTVLIPDCGHWVAEEAPEKLLAALAPFLAPYRDAR
jgi:pimeloyl-ACP methyl ester carboxylesterase